MTAKKSIKKSVKISKPENELFRKLFEQGQRLGMNAKQTKEFLDREYPGVHFKNSNLTVNDLGKRVAFLESQKSLDQNPLDKLAQWRNAAASRINNAKKSRQALIDAFEPQYVKFEKEIASLQKKLDSDTTWYKILGKVISKKIHGFKFTGTVVD